MPAPRAATLLFCHGTSFGKDVWTPIASRLQRTPLLQRLAPARVDMVSFNFPYHGENRDVSQAATINMEDPTAPRVSHPAMDWPTWSTAAVEEQVKTLQAEIGDKATRTAPLIGIGHSMGAAALWAAEVAIPGTFDGLVLFEPMCNADNYPNRKAAVDFLVGVTLKRRAHWDSFEEAEAELLASRNFARWHSESLQAYIKGAVVKVSPENNVLDPQAQYALSLHPHIEAAVYTNDTLPLSEEEMARVRCPITMLYGARTQLFFREFKQPLVDKYPHLYSIAEPIANTTHALVMEDLDAVVAGICDALEKLPPFRHAV